MAKLSVKYKKDQLFIKVKLTKNEEINDRDISVFNTKILRGLMRPTLAGVRKYIYMAPKSISLCSFVKKGIDTNDFFLLLVQIAEVIKKIEKNGLNINNLIMETESVYINETTKEINFVYLPILGNVKNNNVFGFIYEIINLSLCQSEEHNKYVDDFTVFLRGKKYFDANEIENYILQVYPQIYKQIKVDKAGQSQKLYSKKLKYYKSKEEEEYNGESTSLLDDEEGTALLDDEFEGTALLDEQFEGTALLDQEFEGTALLDENENSTSIPDEELEGTALLDEEFEDTSLLDEESEDTSLLDEDTEDTSLLTENDPDESYGGTTLLKQELPNYPFLIRLNTYDRIDVTKSVFKIGKEKSFVDYYIANNNAVSRVHADIITANKKYYVRDNNSTNRTFVNGTEIPVNQEVEIVDGDIVMLANEAFAFHVE